VAGRQAGRYLEEAKIDPPRDGAALLHDALELLLAVLELLERVVLVSVAPLHRLFGLVQQALRTRHDTTRTRHDTCAVCER